MEMYAEESRVVSKRYSAGIVPHCVNVPISIIIIHDSSRQEINLYTCRRAIKSWHKRPHASARSDVTFSSAGVCRHQEFTSNKQSSNFMLTIHEGNRRPTTIRAELSVGWILLATRGLMIDYDFS